MMAVNATSASGDSTNSRIPARTISAVDWWDANATMATGNHSNT